MNLRPIAVAEEHIAPFIALLILDLLRLTVSTKSIDTFLREFGAVFRRLV